MREEKTNEVSGQQCLAWACGFDMQCTIPRAYQVLPIYVYGRIRCNVEGAMCNVKCECVSVRWGK